jgi:hypothetical protein
MMQPSVTRRKVLMAAAGVPVLALPLNGCARPGSETNEATGDIESRTRLVEAESRLLVAFDLVLGQLPDDAQRANLVRRRRRHLWHLEHITATGAVNTLSPDASTPLVSAPTTSEPTQLLRWLASNERSASIAQSGVSSRTTDLALARIAALTSAFERTHGIADLATVAHKDWSPTTGASSQEMLDALSDALEVHYGALWAVGRLGPLLTSADAGRARRFTVEHLSSRDRIRRALISAGRTPPSPAPTYSLTGQPADPSAARSVLRDTERSLAATWLPVIAAARSEAMDPATASAAAMFLGDAAVRAHAWGNREAFPGFGDRLQYLS